MIRRILCLLLTMSTLASQSFCWAHTHHQADERQREHAVRPHWHIGDHGHDHEHHGREHHWHTDHPIQIPSDESEGKLTDAMSPHRDHDTGAVYFDQPVIGFRDCNSAAVVASDQMQGVGLHLVNQDDKPTRAGTARDRPLSIFGIVCPIFLRILSLRL